MPNLHPNIAIKANRKKLGARTALYYQQTEFCRAIGLQVMKGGPLYWIARFRTGKGDSKRTRLCLSDTYRRANGKTVLSYNQALRAAQKWF